jgi:hypothetical protein
MIKRIDGFDHRNLIAMMQALRVRSVFSAITRRERTSRHRILYRELIFCGHMFCRAAGGCASGKI